MAGIASDAEQVEGLLTSIPGIGEGLDLTLDDTSLVAALLQTTSEATLLLNDVMNIGLALNREQFDALSLEDQRDVAKTIMSVVTTVQSMDSAMTFVRENPAKAGMLLAEVADAKLNEALTLIEGALGGDEGAQFSLKKLKNKLIIDGVILVFGGEAFAGAEGIGAAARLGSFADDAAGSLASFRRGRRGLSSEAGKRVRSIGDRPELREVSRNPAPDSVYEFGGLVFETDELEPEQRSLRAS